MYEDFNKWGKEMYEVLEDDYISDAELKVGGVKVSAVSNNTYC